MTLDDIQRIKLRYGIVGNSPELNRDIEVAAQVARTDLSVLVTGESGVGKEFFPRIIHDQSARKHGPYFAINCGAIPEGTIDSELFGHMKGAFTDARAEKKGYFEIADGGTLFLDEVGELPLSTQARLLRVLETGEFIRMGAEKVQKTNVRVVAATNMDMLGAINDGRFREDLYYRLNAIEIHVPSLRQRREDIPLLFKLFASNFCQRNQMPPIRLSEEATHLLKNSYWRGNIRQLKNIAERICVMETARDITDEILQTYLPQDEHPHSPAIRNNMAAGEFSSTMVYNLLSQISQLSQQVHELQSQINGQGTMTNSYTPLSSDIPVAEEVREEERTEIVPPPTMREAQRDAIVRALENNHNVRKRAAAELGMSERTFYRKLKEYGLE